MNAIDMGKYIEYVADRLLVKLNCPKHWNTPNPFPWMELISIQNKTNQFERRVAEYGRAQFNRTTLKAESTSNSAIELLEDF